MPLVEKRYAQAFFELSGNQAIAEELKDFVDIYESDKAFSSFLLDPRIKVDNKQTVIKNVFSDKLSKNTLNFILLLISKTRIEYIHLIYDQFVHLLDERTNVLDIDIFSAIPLDEDQINSIKEKFRVKYKASAVKSNQIVDASLIGGVKVIVGEKVYDGSIKGRIESLTDLVSVKK
jgi:F-type H+-transporting ATPase subunit delta